MKYLFLISVVFFFAADVFANGAHKYSFPVYNYEELIQVDAKACSLNIRNQHIIVDKHYQAGNKLLAFQWLSNNHKVDDAQKVYRSLPGLNLQSHTRLRDMYVFEKVASQILAREKKMLLLLGGNSAGNNYNRLQAKSSNIVASKLKMSVSHLESFELTLLKLLGVNIDKKSTHSEDNDPLEKGSYKKGFKAGFYEATFAPEGLEKIHNRTCMWNPDRVITDSKPYCGYVWSHAGNMYLERCPGDVHPFGVMHRQEAGVQSSEEIFNLRKVGSCPPDPMCKVECFNYCIKKNEFKSLKSEKLKNGICTHLVDPLFPSHVKERTLTDQYLKDFKTRPNYYPKFKENERDERDVTYEIERYYLMTGEYNKNDCKKGKRQLIIEILDATKQLISLEKNLIEFYSTTRDCYIKLAEKIETVAGVGVRHYAVDKKEGKAAQVKGDRAILASAEGSGDLVQAMTKQEQEEADASFFGLNNRQQNKLLKNLINNDYKFTRDDIGKVCKRKMALGFCGGKETK